MIGANEREEPGIGERIREYVDNHRLATYFLLIEASLVFAAWYLDTWMSVTLTPNGEDLSDIVAGLLGGWAVVFALLGLVGVCLLAASRLWLAFDRRTHGTAD